MPVKSYHEGFLLSAVGSMLAQTCRAWRLLVIADTSVHGELEHILTEHLADPRIELITARGRQIAGSFNTGMRRAETDFVGILLGDDLWEPAAVEVLTRNIEGSPATDFLHSSRRYVDGQSMSISSVYRSRTTVSAADFMHFAPVKHLLCWRREMGLAIGGMDESLNSVGVDDFDFPWSMADHGATFRAIPECLYVYRDHRDGYRLSTHLTLRHQKREIVRIMRKHGADSTTIAARLAQAEQGFLRQCLYRSRLDRWVKTIRGRDPGSGWREPYR